MKNMEFLEMIEHALHADPKVPRFGSSLDWGIDTLSITLVETQETFTIRASDIAND